MKRRSTRSNLTVAPALPPVVALQRTLAASHGVLSACGAHVRFKTLSAAYLAPTRCTVNGRLPDVGADGLLPWAKACADALEPFEIHNLQFETACPMRRSEQSRGGADADAVEAMARFVLAVGMRAVQHCNEPAVERFHLFIDTMLHPAAHVVPLRAGGSNQPFDIADLQRRFREDAGSWLDGLTQLEFEGEFAAPTGHRAAALTRRILGAGFDAERRAP